MADKGDATWKPPAASVPTTVIPSPKKPEAKNVPPEARFALVDTLGVQRDFPSGKPGDLVLLIADKEAVVPVAKMLAGLGFEIISTAGTHAVLSRHDVPATRISKLAEGRPNIKDFIKNGKVQLIVNTPTRKGPRTDEGKIRSLAVLNKVPIVTTITGAGAAARAIEALQAEEWGVKPLQAYYPADRR